MSVLIVGAEGSMGKRYRAILNFLGRTYQCADKEKTPDQVKNLAKQSEGVIIATPTDTHAQFIELLADLGKPILCEKPVVKDTTQLETLFSILNHHRTPFRMMMQYQKLCHSARIGPSLYNYFKTGSDGLSWDCLQIIGLARGAVTIDNVSPVWSCKINGQRLRLEDMDAAYIAYVQDWFNYPKQDFGIIREMHAKTAKYAETAGYKYG
jgi:hypothetical protein